MGRQSNQEMIDILSKRVDAQDRSTNDILDKIQDLRGKILKLERERNNREHIETELVDQELLEFLNDSRRYEV